MLELPNLQVANFQIWKLALLDIDLDIHLDIDLDIFFFILLPPLAEFPNREIWEGASRNGLFCFFFI